jgi:hypothetical protein
MAGLHLEFERQVALSTAQYPRSPPTLPGAGEDAARQARPPAETSPPRGARSSLSLSPARGPSSRIRDSPSSHQVVSRAQLQRLAQPKPRRSVVAAAQRDGESRRGDARQRTPPRYPRRGHAAPPPPPQQQEELPAQRRRQLAVPAPGGARQPPAVLRVPAHPMGVRPRRGVHACNTASARRCTGATTPPRARRSTSAGRWARAGAAGAGAPQCADVPTRSTAKYEQIRQSRQRQREREELARCHHDGVRSPELRALLGLPRRAEGAGASSGGAGGGDSNGEDGGGGGVSGSAAAVHARLHAWEASRRVRTVPMEPRHAPPPRRPSRGAHFVVVVVAHVGVLSGARARACVCVCCCCCCCCCCRAWWRVYAIEQARRAEERAAHFGATAAVLGDGEQDEPFLLRAEPWVEGLQQGAVWRSELGGGGGGGVGGGSGAAVAAVAAGTADTEAAAAAAAAGGGRPSHGGDAASSAPGGAGVGRAAGGGGGGARRTPSRRQRAQQQEVASRLSTPRRRREKAARQAAGPPTTTTATPPTPARRRQGVQSARARKAAREQAARARAKQPRAAAAAGSC